MLPPLPDGTPALPDDNDFAKFAWQDGSATSFERIDHCQFVRRTMDFIPEERRHTACLGTTEMADKCIDTSGKSPWPPYGEYTTTSKAGCYNTCKMDAKCGRWSLRDYNAVTDVGYCYTFVASGINLLSARRMAKIHGGKWAMYGLSDCTLPFQHANFGTCIAVPPPGARNSDGMTADAALAACKKRAGAEKGSNHWMIHINLVPLTPPPGVSMAGGGVAGTAYYNSDTSSTNIGEGMNIPWGIGNCKESCFANEPAGSSVCYPLRVYGKRSNAEQDMQIIPDDPENQIFFSSCYRQVAGRTFEGAQCAPTQCVKTVPSEWRFKDQCISCADVTYNADADKVPSWVIQPLRRCVACSDPLSEGPVLESPPPDQPIGGWTSPGDGVSMSYIRTKGTRSSVSFTLTCTACDADGWVAVGISPDNKMVATQGILWRLDLGSVQEVVLNGQAKSAIVAYDDSVISDVMMDAAAKTVSFTASAIGSLQIATSGPQTWAWAYGAAGFAYHGSNKGVSSLNFDLDRDLSDLPAPTPPPLFDPNNPPKNVNDGEPETSATQAVTGALSGGDNAGLYAIMIVASLVGPFLIIVLIVAIIVAAMYIAKVKYDAKRLSCAAGKGSDDDEVGIDLSVVQGDDVGGFAQAKADAFFPPLPPRPGYKAKVRRNFDVFSFSRISILTHMLYIYNF